MSWSRLVADSVAAADALADQAAGLPDGAGVFRSRGGFTLYFSPVATSLLSAAAGARVEACARPREEEVDLVAGAFDDPAWYDHPIEDMTADLDVIELDEMGLIEPDSDIEQLRREHLGR